MNRSYLPFEVAPLALLMSLLAGQGAAPERQALSTQIDRLIAQRLEKEQMPAAPLAEDSEFLRRAYLDITGRIPTYEQTRGFLDSKEADKRTKLIDELLGRPEFGLYFATLWRDRIAERTNSDSQVRQNHSWEFVAWLADGLNRDRGWNELVADMIAAEGDAKKNPATTLVLAKRMGNFSRADDLTALVGKLFMGIQLRCAQCHEHPYVRNWSQDDFWGMAAFFGQLREHGIEGNGLTRNPIISELPNPDAKKEAAYLGQLKRTMQLIAPLPGPQIAIPDLEDPTKVHRVVKAKFFLGAEPELPAAGPYRPQLAAWLTAAENPYFARAAVNRLWDHFFARGLVHPVDDMRPGRAGSHPELLDLLEKDFKTTGFHTKSMIRAICSTQAYQRTSRPGVGNRAADGENPSDTELFGRMAVKVLNADQMIDALAVAVARAPTVGKARDQATAVFVTKDPDDDATRLNHGIPQFLYQLNTGVANSNPPVVGRLTTGKSKEDAITALYLAALSRPPSPKETKRLLAYLGSGESQQGYRDIYWALLNSAEFMLNH